MLLNGQVVIEMYQEQNGERSVSSFLHVSLQYNSPLATFGLQMSESTSVLPQLDGNKILVVPRVTESWWRSALECINDCDFRWAIHIKGYHMWSSDMHVNR
eukprot:1409459-Amphidinium_carterae.1